MYKYKLVIAYDGTAYHGWQIQPDALTVAGVIQARFKKVFGRDCSMIAASRTDTGVHALGQVARIITDLCIDTFVLQRALNGALPSDIHIRSVTKITDTFHPLYNVDYKIYYYHIFVRRPLPQWARYGHYTRKFSVEKFKEALTIFVGTHDFRSFCTGDDKESTIRTIQSIECVYDRRMCAYRVVIKGKSFLRYMIRRIVGAALHVAVSDEYEVSFLCKVLEEKNPEQLLPTAPAHGLLLRKIIYK